MIKVVKQKHDVISSRERSKAKSIALTVDKPRTLSVWEVLIPIIFIFSYLKAKSNRDVFADNLLFTKNMALKAAYDRLQKDKTREAVIDRIKSQTGELLSSLPNNIYSDAIRQEQLKEIDLLVEHYYRLLQADGRDYDDLVRNTYGNRVAYESFLNRLKSAEKAVVRAAHRTLGPSADAAMATRIEDASNRIRIAELDRIFGRDDQ